MNLIANEQVLLIALYDLCLHPEYVEPLRREAEQRAQSGYSDEEENMPLLDSFLKESARLGPTDSSKFFDAECIDYHAD